MVGCTIQSHPPLVCLSSCNMLFEKIESMALLISNFRIRAYRHDKRS
uniref:Uncharacterized protein n=1 Tax=Rhizophora mucronata TaxID=61149 RepID=A0A2P2NAK2_RHIMU